MRKDEKQVDKQESSDKFTAQARRVLSLAQEEARSFQHNYIGTEHLLLGLICENEGVAAIVLRNLGVELNKVRSAVEFIIGRGDRIVLGEMGLTPRSKKVIELAVDEARLLHHYYIGTEHLLLGLIREGEGIAAGVLDSLGVNLENARTQTIRVLSLPQDPLPQPAQSELVQSISSHETQEPAKEPENTISNGATNPLEVNQFATSTGQIQPVLPGHVFIAYSRRDYYFTESLFYALHSNGINAWMDVWKITPGDNWEDDIAQALASSRGVVLVATKESVRSPFVKGEICQAHSAKKPVYLVIRGNITKKDLYFEYKDPKEQVNEFNLYDYASTIVDMRAGFRKGVTKLADAICSHRTYQKHLPSPFSFKTEPILSLVWIILFLTLVMALTEIWKYGSGIFVEDLVNQSMGYIRDILHGKVSEILFLVPTTISHYLSLFVEVTFVLFSFNFMRRKQVQASDFFNVMLRDMLGLGIIILLQDFTGAYENVYFFYFARSFFAQSASALPVDAGVFILLCLHCILFFLIIILLIVFCVMFNAQDGRGAILRWLPTGKASQTIRWKGNAEWIRKLPNIRVSPAPSYRSYCIVASEEDRAIANDIKAILHRKGLQTTDRHGDAECDLIILSLFADDCPLKEDCQRNSSKPIIYVLARSIKPPLTRIQWIDYRRPSENQFWKQWERHFEQLKSDEPVFPYVPETQLKSLIPRKYGKGMLFTIAVVAGGSAWLLSSMEYPMFLGNTSSTIFLPISIICMLGAVGMNYLTLVQMLRGTTSLGRVRGWLFLAGILSIIAALIAQNRSLIVSSLVIAFLNLLTIWSAQKSILTWLPPKAKRTNKKSLLQPITYYKALTSHEYSILVIAGFLLLNTLVVHFWIIPPLTQQSPLEPYAVTVPGPYYLAAQGLWSQDTLANTFGFHLTYQSDRLEVSQNHTATGGSTWIKFLGTNAYPRQFAPHFRSSIHIQFANDDPRTAFSMIFDDASRQQFTLLAPGFWQVNGSSTPGYSGQIAASGQASGYTLEVEVNGILCTYKINGQKVATVANTAISSINNIEFMVANVNPDGARLYLSHFTYTPLPGPVLSRNAAIQFVNARNSAAYTTVAPGWTCNPTAERWSPLFEPRQNTALTCTPSGTRLNDPEAFLDFDNNGFGGLPDAFTYSFQAAFQDVHTNQCLFVGTNAVETTGIAYLYEFVICADGTWVTKRVGYRIAHLSVFLNQQFASGHIQKQKTVALRIAFHSMTQDLYINNQLVTSYRASAPQSAFLSLFFGNDKGAVIYSHFSFAPETK